MQIYAYNFFHKDNKDISSNPTTLPAGGTRKDLRKQKQVELKDERVAAKTDCPVEKYGDIDHQIKKAGVNEMHSQAKGLW